MLKVDDTTLEKAEGTSEDVIKSKERILKRKPSDEEDTSFAFHYILEKSRKQAILKVKENVKEICILALKIESDVQPRFFVI